MVRAAQSRILWAGLPPWCPARPLGLYLDSWTEAAMRCASHPDPAHIIAVVIRIRGVLARLPIITASRAGRKRGPTELASGLPAVTSSASPALTRALSARKNPDALNTHAGGGWARGTERVSKEGENGGGVGGVVTETLFAFLFSRFEMDFIQRMPSCVKCSFLCFSLFVRCYGLA